MKLSIVIPVYNVSAYLERCLESILQQDAKDYEIICVDDGSTDDSFDILSCYQKKFSEMKVIRQSNGGASAARNKGLQEACGEWIAFIDADDYVTDAFFEIIYDSMEADCDMILFQSDDLENGNKSYTKYYGQEQKELLIKSILLSCKLFLPELKANLRTPWGKIYRHSFLTNHNLYYAAGCISGQDQIFNLWCMNYISKVKYVERQVYCYEYCVNSNSLSAGYMTDIYERISTYFRELDRFLMENPQYREEYNLLVLNDVFLRLKRYFFHREHSVTGKKLKQELKRFFLQSRYQKAYQDTSIWICRQYLGTVKAIVLASIFSGRQNVAMFIFKCREIYQGIIEK